MGKEMTPSGFRGVPCPSLFHDFLLGGGITMRDIYRKSPKQGESLFSQFLLPGHNGITEKERVIETEAKQSEWMNNPSTEGGSGVVQNFFPLSIVSPSEG